MAAGISPSTDDRAWAWFTGVGLAVTVVAGLLPNGVPSDVLYGVVGLAAFVAILAGVRRHRPALRLPWLLMASAQLVWVLGDLYYSWHDDVAGLTTFPTIGDALYLAAYPLFAAALLVLVMHRHPSRDLGGLLDSATVTAGLALLSWVLLAGPSLAQADSTPAAVLVTVGYPVGDILLMGGLIRLLGMRGTRTPSFRMLLTAVALLVVADVIYAVMNLHSDADTDWINVLWLASYVAWGAAALHPSMARLGEPVAEVETVVSRMRLLAFSTAILTAPGILAVQTLVGHSLDVWPVVLGSVVMFGLVMARMAVAIQRIAEVMRQRSALQDELEHRAAHDGLTGLANRAQMMVELDAALARSQRTGEPVGLLFVDLDGFKAVNDTFGHRAGDTVLRMVADRLTQGVRGGDTVGRLGGDEFVVLLEPVEADQAALAVAERVVRAVARPVDLGRLGTARIGASVGVSVARSADLTAEGFLHEADTAAYRAKTGGKGRAELYDAHLRAEVTARQELEDALAGAVERDELVLHYQPIVRVGSLQVTGYEALLRWDRPGHGLVYPAEFIPLAEKSSLICELDAWALRRACRDFAGVPAGPDGNPQVGVNVSGRHLGRSRILDDVAVALAEARLPAQRLVVELTETALVDDAVAVRHLSVLREGGVSINIDDFGTGYSAISRLGALPIDNVKIDRRFVDPDSTSAPVLLQLMVEAAHAHGLPVVVEGIEHVHQLRTLQSLGCEAAQGYLLGRPGPLAEVLARPAPAEQLELSVRPE